MITKEQARQFKARWKLVNEIVLEETRRTSVERKLQQLAVMYDAGCAFGWRAAEREAEDAKARHIWCRLKKSHNEGND